MVKKTNPYMVATWVLVGILVLGGITGLIAFGNNGGSQTIEDKKDFCFSSQMSDADNVCRAYGCNGRARYFVLEDRGENIAGYKVVLNCKNIDESACLSLVWDDSTQIHN